MHSAIRRAQQGVDSSTQERINFYFILWLGAGTFMLDYL